MKPQMPQWVYHASNTGAIVFLVSWASLAIWALASSAGIPYNDAMWTWLAVSSVGILGILIPLMTSKMYSS